MFGVTCITAMQCIHCYIHSNKTEGPRDVPAPRSCCRGSSYTPLTHCLTALYLYSSYTAAIQQLYRLYSYTAIQQLYSIHPLQHPSAWAADGREVSIGATRDEVTSRPDTARAGSGSVCEVPIFASDELAEENQWTPTKARRRARALL